MNYEMLQYLSIGERNNGAMLFNCYFRIKETETKCNHFTAALQRAILMSRQLFR